MKSSPPLERLVKVGELLRRRLRELKRSPAELAEAAQVPTDYIDDLISGRRRPPLPGRTDLYERMTTFLRLGRNDLVNCARAERAAAAPTGNHSPQAGVERLLLELCDPATARELEQRRAQRGGTEIASFSQRLLDVTQGSVRRMLDDQIGLRVAAAQGGSTYVALRLRVLEFLDATPDTLTVDDVGEFVRPRIASWDVDFQTGVLRVVLRAQEPREPYRRTPRGRRPVSRPRGANPARRSE